MRIIRALLVAIAFALAITLVIISAFFVLITPDRVSKTLSSLVEERLNLKLQLENQPEIKIFPTLKISLPQGHLLNQKDEAVGRFDNAFIEMNPFAYFAISPKIYSISINGLDLNIGRDDSILEPNFIPKKSWNIDNILFSHASFAREDIGLKLSNMSGKISDVSESGGKITIDSTVNISGFECLTKAQAQYTFENNISKFSDVKLSGLGITDKSISFSLDIPVLTPFAKQVVEHINFNYKQNNFGSIELSADNITNSDSDLVLSSSKLVYYPNNQVQKYTGSFKAFVSRNLSNINLDNFIVKNNSASTELNGNVEINLKNKIGKIDLTGVIDTTPAELSFTWNYDIFQQINKDYKNEELVATKNGNSSESNLVTSNEQTINLSNDGATTTFVMPYTNNTFVESVNSIEEELTRSEAPIKHDDSFDIKDNSCSLCGSIKLGRIQLNEIFDTLNLIPKSILPRTYITLETTNIGTNTIIPSINNVRAIVRIDDGIASIISTEAKTLDGNLRVKAHYNTSDSTWINNFEISDAQISLLKFPIEGKATISRKISGLSKKVSESETELNINTGLLVGIDIDKLAHDLIEERATGPDGMTFSKTQKSIFTKLHLNSIVKNGKRNISITILGDNSWKMNLSSSSSTWNNFKFNGSLFLGDKGVIIPISLNIDTNKTPLFEWAIDWTQASESITKIYGEENWTIDNFSRKLSRKFESLISDAKKIYEEAISEEPSSNEEDNFPEQNKNKSSLNKFVDEVKNYFDSLKMWIESRFEKEPINNQSKPV